MHVFALGEGTLGELDVTGIVFDEKDVDSLGPHDKRGLFVFVL
jgi:hypothetical protein